MILPPRAAATAAAAACSDDSSSSTDTLLPNDDADHSVNCVAFHPSSFTTNESSSSSSRSIGYNNNDVSVAAPANAAAEIYDDNPCMVYVTSSNRIYGYDIRQHTTAIIITAAASSSPTIPTIKTPRVDLTSMFHCTDEINQLSFSYPNTTTTDYNSNKTNATIIGSSYRCMSTVDDSGEARVIINYDAWNDANDDDDDDDDCKERLLSRRMSRTSISNSNNNNNTTTLVLHHAKPETLSIASCATFRPKQRSQCTIVRGKKKKKNCSNNNNDGISYLATAGTDCTIKLWDIDMNNNNKSSSNGSNNSCTYLGR